MRTGRKKPTSDIRSKQVSFDFLNEQQWPNFYDPMAQYKVDRGFLRYTIPPDGSMVVLSVFFQFFTMGKMVICSMYIIWKEFPAAKVT
jgi:hypothetical protein